jgi:hypothetical protein
MISNIVATGFCALIAGVSAVFSKKLGSFLDGLSFGIHFSFDGSRVRPKLRPLKARQPSTHGCRTRCTESPTRNAPEKDVRSEKSSLSRKSKK